MQLSGMLSSREFPDHLETGRTSLPGEFDKKVDPFDEHSMAHTWKHGTGMEPGSGGDGTQDAAGSQPYYANCGDCPGDGTSGGWVGPNRSTRGEAQADADAHNRSNPGHGAVVVSLK